MTTVFRTRHAARWLLAALALFACTFALPARADLIPRTITIDGTFTDWTDPGNTATPPGDILSNPGQFGTDCQSGTACELDGTLKSTGRDLKKFAFTWNATRLFFYIERWDSGSNVTDWWFYMDTGGDGKMQSGEKVMRVRWTGSNRSTVVSVWNYVQAVAGGDPVRGPGGTADGYTMPGTLTGETAVYTANGGGTGGLAMESYIPWASLGVSGPVNMTFHVSSSNGSSLPANVIDNVEGPGANQLFPSDLQVEKTASASTVSANSTFTYTVTARNLGFAAFTAVAISDLLPADVVYLSHSATLGTFTDTGSDGVPDRWNIATLPLQSAATLTITVRAANVTSTVVATNTATLVAYTGQNFYTTNDSASVAVTITPSPVISVTKFASTATATPGQVIRYNAYLSNVGFSVATSVVVVDTFSPFTAFRLDTFGAGQPLQLTDGTPASTLVMGTPQYSSNNGATWTYVPVSGGGGAPAGYDANVTRLRVPLTGTMPGNGANLTLTYDVIVR